MRNGYVLGERYQIIRSLGEGGMANVYLAHDLILDRDVSVKLLRLDLRDDPATIRRFKREAMAATELVSDHIVQMYDVGSDHGMEYLVMEYVDGTDLKEYIAAHFPIAYQEVINIMMQVLAAVQTAHDHDIIHRDLKPQNILITDDGLVKITDFGIAVARSDQALTQTNTVLGSVHYLSPEQARGGMVTKRSDLYSLGIILYELLTGKVPFEGETAVSIALKHYQADMPSVRDIDPRIPQALENVVLKATAKDPRDRYPDAYSMAADLKTSLSASRAGEPRFVPTSRDEGETKVLADVARPIGHAATTTGPKPAGHPTKETTKKKPHRKRRLVFAALGVLLLLLFGAIGGAMLFRPQMTVVPDVTNVTEMTAKSRLTRANLTVGDVHRVANSRVARRHVVRTEPRSGTQLKQKTAVDLWISTGPKQITVADYTGDAYTSTAAALTAMGFTVHRESVNSTSVPAGRILQQSIPSGQRVIPTQTDITFTVSTGSKQITLKDLTGLSKAAAQKYATDHNLNLAFKYDYSNDTPKDHVMHQSPGDGAVVKEGDDITVTLSRGAKPAKAPDKPDQFTVTITVPFDGSEVASTDSEDDSSSQTSENVVQVYLKDADHSMDQVYKQLTITKSTAIDLPFTLKTGESGAYKVVRDGKVIALNNNVTKNNH